MEPEQIVIDEVSQVHCDSVVEILTLATDDVHRIDWVVILMFCDAFQGTWDLPSVELLIRIRSLDFVSVSLWDLESSIVKSHLLVYSLTLQLFDDFFHIHGLSDVGSLNGLIPDQLV